MFRDSRNVQIHTDMPNRAAILSVKRARAAMLQGVLSNLRVGRLTIQLPSGATVVHTADHCALEAQIVLHRWRAIRRLVSRGGIGFAEAYIEGEWTTPNLSALLELAAANVDSLERLMAGSALLRALSKVWRIKTANTRQGSRRNIAAHYDLGNAFYARWLDAGMSYSSAWYRDPNVTLEEAQIAKQDRVIDHLALKGGERVLEIGCGWGGLMERMLRRGAGHVTGITLSAEQLAFASQRIEQIGMRDRAQPLLKDYRDVDERFDRIASIEMLEAVGEDYWPIYFDMLKNKLAEGGLAVVQVITIAKARFEDYRRGADFIQRYIFPGGMLPTDEIVRREIKNAGMALRSVETFGDSYAQTLAEWRRRFNEAWPSIQPLGFDLRFKRMWEYYLSYCEAGFRAGVLDVGLYCFGHFEGKAA